VCRDLNVWRGRGGGQLVADDDLHPTSKLSINMPKMYQVMFTLSTILSSFHNFSHGVNGYMFSSSNAMVNFRPKSFLFDLLPLTLRRSLFMTSRDPPGAMYTLRREHCTLTKCIITKAYHKFVTKIIRRVCDE
jgi:hypothetical protein